MGAIIGSLPLGEVDRKVGATALLDTHLPNHFSA